MRRFFSPVIFGLALMCFFLPWITVSCSGQKIVTLSGIQLATGTTIKEPKMFEGSERPYSYAKRSKGSSERIKGDIFAIIALLASIGGIGMGFLKDRESSIGSAVTGSIGVISLIILSIRLNNQILKEGGGLLQLDYRIGFYLTLFFFLSATVINIYSLVSDKIPTLYLPDIFAGKKHPSVKFCSQCGAQVSPDDTFCHQCGRFLK